MLKGFTRNFQPLRTLTEGQVEAIWRGALDVLEHTGLEFQSKKALKILDKGGCKVDYDDRRVKFPPGLVTECLHKCPSSFRLEARDPKNDLIIGGNTVYIMPGPGMQYLDIDTFEPREATRKEFYDAVTVYDALPNLHCLHNNSPNFSFESVPPVMATIESYAARARNSTKVNRIAHSFGNQIFNMQIAEVVGAKGMYACGGSAPPLSFSEDGVNGFITAVEAGFPVGCDSGATWGGTSPATIAGSVTLTCAEDVGQLVLAQLIHSGHPVYVAQFTFPQNMRTGAPFFDNIAIGLSNAAFHQVWRKYGIPTVSIEPAIPSSKSMDFQSGYEKGMLALAAAISGANLVWLYGTVYGELTAHPIQAIMDDDISGMIGRFLEGITVNHETLAIDLIEEVGSAPGFYLDKEHTRKWWRKEQFIPTVADILTLPEWLKEGKKTCLDNAKERMKEILATHKVSTPLTTSQEEDIEKILEDARKYYKKKGMM